jgi:endonuclease/exonuclease/phosphatase family metal-dependent hydrolase
MSTTSLEDSIDESVLYLSKPFWKATEFFLTNDSSWTGVAGKVVGITIAIFQAPLAMVGEMIYLLSQKYYQKSYSFYESKAAKREGNPSKFLSLNACMFPGGLPTIFGGVSPAGARMDALTDFLKKQKADIVCLQEMACDPAKQLINKIKDDYRYFYYRIGPNPFNMESAIFFASKYELKNQPQFIAFKVPGMQGGIRRGFFIAELESCYVITTHLDPHAHHGDVRAQQIEAILTHIRTLYQKPIFLMGDLNIESQDTKACNLLKENFTNFKADDVDHPTEQNATCYDNLLDVIRDPKIEPKWAVVDHILIYKGSSLTAMVQEKIPTFDPKQPAQALSDHHAVTLVLQGTSKSRL